MGIFCEKRSIVYFHLYDKYDILLFFFSKNVGLYEEI